MKKKSTPHTPQRKPEKAPRQPTKQPPSHQPQTRIFPTDIETLTDLLRTTMDAIICVDHNQRIIFFNPAAEQLFGWSESEMMGRPLDRLLPERFREAHHRHVLAFSHSQATKRSMGRLGTIVGLRADGEEISLEATISHAGVADSRIMSVILRDLTERKRNEDIIQRIAEGTLASTGGVFFRSLVTHLAGTLDVAYAFVGELIPGKEDHVRTVAVFGNGKLSDNMEYALAHTPCETVIEQGLQYYPSDVQKRFPLDTFLVEMGVESYIGCPLKDSSGHIGGLMAILDRKPLTNLQRVEAVITIFAARAAAELERTGGEDALRKSEERFHSLARMSPVGIFQTDALGRCLYVNERWCEIVGMPEEDAKGEGWVNGLHPADRERVASKWDEAVRHRLSFQSEFRFQHPNGTSTWVLGQASATRGHRETITGYVGTITDITDRKRAEIAKEKSNALLDAISRAQSYFMNEGLPSATFDSLLTSILALTHSAFGFIGEVLRTADGVPYLKIHALTNNVWNEETHALYERLAPNLEFFNLETLFGRVITSGQAVLANDPAHDSRRVGLPEGHPPLDSFLGLPIYHGQDLVGMIGVANRPGGYEEQIIEYLQPFLNSCGSILQGYQEIQARKKAEEALWQLHDELELRVRERTARISKINDLLKIEVADRQRAEEETRRYQTFLTSILEHIPNMIFVKDARDLTFLAFNKAGENLLGFSREDLIAKNDHDFFSKEETDFFIAKDREVLESKQPVEISEESIKTRYKGSRSLHTKKIPILDEQGIPRYLLGISEDITERKQLEEQLQRAAKLEAVGQLAGGIAHDFNNLLTVILGYSQILLHHLDPENSHRTELREIMKAGDRAQSLVKQLLAFSRRQVLHPTIGNLNAVVSVVVPMLKRLIGENITITTVLQPNPVMVKADSGQLENVLINLAVNARDAMPQGGILTIRTNCVVFPDSTSPDTPSGPYAELLVTDTGSGMDPATREQIFDPFFSTKEVGKGTGLGLATVYGTIKQSEGFIFLDSTLGRGTTFKIYLPNHPTDVEPPVGVPSPVKEVRGTETILLVEDDPGVRGLLYGALGGHGYTVLVAQNGHEAVATAGRHNDPIHLLLTDMIMPQMNGDEVAARLAPERPDMKILLMSGYTEDAWEHNIQPFHRAYPLLEKPFTTDVMVSEVRRVLDGLQERW